MRRFGQRPVKIRPSAEPSLCSRIVSLSNDVFSYEKEKRHHNPNNIVHLLMTHYKIGRQEDLSYSVAIINQYLAEFTSLSASFLEKENSETIGGYRGIFFGQLERVDTHEGGRRAGPPKSRKHRLTSKSSTHIQIELKV